MTRAASEIKEIDLKQVLDALEIRMTIVEEGESQEENWYQKKSKDHRFW